VTAGRATPVTSPAGAPDDRGSLGATRRLSTRGVPRRLSTRPPDRLGRWLQGPVGIWALRAVALGFILLIITTGHTQIDRAEVAAPAQAIAGGHLDQAYVAVPHRPDQPPALQAPGFPLLAGLAMAIWDGVVGPDGAAGALTFAGFAAAGLVLFAGARVAGIGDRGRRREVAFLIAMAVTPFFREALGNYYHPEDVLALGFLLLSLALVGDRRWLGAGVCLGLAVGCKQWALLALPPLIVTADGRQARWKLVGAAAGSSALVYLPLMLAAPHYAWKILSGPAAVAGGIVPQTTIVGMLREAPFHIPQGEVEHLGRVLPLLFAIGLAWYWWRQHSTPNPTAKAENVRLVSFDQVLRLVLICLAFRLVADCIALSYYALPLVAFVAIVDSRRSRLPGLAIGSGLALAFWYGSGAPGFLLDPWSGALVFTAGVAAIVVGTLAARMHPSTVPA
jgi:Glycosyltransferase family 87